MPSDLPKPDPSGASADHSRFVQRVRRRYAAELPLLPPGATVVDLPHGDSEIFTLLADEIAGHLREFFA